jgi:hypothetical protein
MHALDMDMVVDSTFSDPKLGENMRANSSRTMLPFSEAKLEENNTENLDLLQFKDYIEGEKKADEDDK